MGRRSRRFAVRAAAVGVALVGGWASYHRWQLRRGAIISLRDDITTEQHRPQSRSARFHRLKDSARDHPFDVLVIGGGAVGLYTAVDAAQRGLRVAVVDADDFGAGSTGTSPPLIPGAFPYVQRALRQRDVFWLYRAVEAWRALTVWSNVAPGALENRVPTLIPSSHVMELAEFTAAALVATLLSPFVGQWRPFRFVHGDDLRRELDGTEDGLRGGVVVEDALLDGNAVSVALARTAEALGVVALNYAAATRIANVEPESELNNSSANFAVDVHDVSAPEGVAEVISEGVTVYTRSIANCSGSWVNDVRQLMPNSAEYEVPAATEKQRYQVKSYLVLPRSAVHTKRNENVDSFFGAKSFLASTTSYSFSPVMMLPWLDACVVIGPSVSSLSQLPTKTYTVAPGTVMTMIDTKNNSESGNSGNLRNAYESQQRHLCNALRAAGVHIDEDHALSYISCIVPILASSLPNSLLEDIFMKGYHISAGTEDPRVVHVYGGSLGFARDIAEKAVDQLLHDGGAFTKSETRSLSPCKTRCLALIGAQSSDVADDVASSPAVRVQRFVREKYAVRVQDVVARRTHTAYSSPAEALRALPAIAEIMSTELGWTPERRQVELDLARAFIRSISVT